MFYIFGFILFSLAAGSTTLKSCTVERDTQNIHYGRCIILLGGSKACSTGTYLNPAGCANLDSGDPCEIETFDVVSLSGVCVSLGTYELCKTEDNTLSFSDDCTNEPIDLQVHPRYKKS